MKTKGPPKIICTHLLNIFKSSSSSIQTLLAKKTEYEGKKGCLIDEDTSGSLREMHLVTPPDGQIVSLLWDKKSTMAV